MKREVKDMSKCSGGVLASMGTTVFQCGNPVSPESWLLVPLCEAHLLDFMDNKIKGFEEKIAASADALNSAYKRGHDDLVQQQADARASRECQSAKRREATSVVYFLRCGRYIKIGTTVDLEARVSTIRKSGGVLMPPGLPYGEAELLQATPGGLREERRLHTQFAHLRHTGEWFTEAPELTAYIDSLAVAA